MTLGNAPAGSFVELADKTKYSIIGFVVGSQIFVVNFKASQPASSLLTHHFDGAEEVNLVSKPKKSWIKRVKKYIKHDNKRGHLDNLDFIEALANLKEYEVS